MKRPLDLLSHNLHQNVQADVSHLNFNGICRRDDRGVDAGTRSMRRRACRLIVHQRGPLLGQPDELVGRVVEARVHSVLEVGRRRDVNLFLLLRKHFRLQTGTEILFSFVVVARNETFFWRDFETFCEKISRNFLFSNPGNVSKSKFLNAFLSEKML